MNLWIVYNGYTGETAIHVLVIALTGERAIELAREKLKDHWQADAKHDGERYYRNLTAEFVCDATSEFASDVDG